MKTSESHKSRISNDGSHENLMLKTYENNLLHVSHPFSTNTFAKVKTSPVSVS